MTKKSIDDILNNGKEQVAKNAEAKKEAESKKETLESYAKKIGEEKLAKTLKLKYLVSYKHFPVDDSEYGVNPKVQYDLVTKKYFIKDDLLGLKIPSDKDNLLDTPNKNKNILEKLEPLAKIVLGLEFEMTKDNIFSHYQKTAKFSETLEKKRLYVDLTLRTAYLIVKTGRLINEFLVQPQFTLTGFEKLIKSVKANEKLNLLSKEKIDLTDIGETLKGINRIFSEINFDKLINPKRLKPNNKAFKLNKIEPTPNHKTCLDILTLLIKPKEFTDKEHSREVKIISPKSKNDDIYTSLKVAKPESIDIGEMTFTVPNYFDWKDRKILRLVFTEALLHKSKFPLSFKWVLEKIGDRKTGGKNLEEKLEDLRKRFLKYKAVSIRWRYKKGKKIDVGNISGGDIFILQTSDFYERKIGKGYDIEADIWLGDWFESNRNLIKQFTRIPEKLISIDTTYHWLAYALGEKLCSLLRTNKKNILNSQSAYSSPLTLSIKSFLDENLNPIELQETLESKNYKCTRLKQKIINEIKYLSTRLNWKIRLKGIKTDQSFTEFYSLVHIIAQLDPDLESEILGGKRIKSHQKKIKPPLTIEGDVLKSLRKKLKLTQKTFAQSLGYDRTLISKIERGRELASEEFIKTLYQKYSAELS